MALLPQPLELPEPSVAPALNAEQAAAVAAIAQGGASGNFSPFLLYGVTGSGKTEVYLHAIADALARDDNAQVLMLVPEINLTPQLEARIAARFPGVPMAALHSGLAEQPRALNWLAGVVPSRQWRQLMASYRGGLALERLYQARAMQYRLLIAVNA